MTPEFLRRTGGFQNGKVVYPLPQEVGSLTESRNFPPPMTVRKLYWDKKPVLMIADCTSAMLNCQEYAHCSRLKFSVFLCVSKVTIGETLIVWRTEVASSWWHPLKASKELDSAVIVVVCNGKLLWLSVLLSISSTKLSGQRSPVFK